MITITSIRTLAYAYLENEYGKKTRSNRFQRDLDNPQHHHLFPHFVRTRVRHAYGSCRRKRRFHALLRCSRRIFLASGSDMVDGWIARKFNMQSGIGMVLDPIADKLMHVSVLACLAFCTGLTPLGQNLVANGTLSNPWFVHYAFVILIFAKEFIQAMIALYVLKKGATVKANWLGKVSSFTISVGVILAFFHNYVQYADWGILAWGIALSYGAAFSYLKETMKQVKLVKEGKLQAATAESVKAEDQKSYKKRKTALTKVDFLLKNLVPRRRRLLGTF